MPPLQNKHFSHTYIKKKDRHRHTHRSEHILVQKHTHTLTIKEFGSLHHSSDIPPPPPPPRLGAKEENNEAQARARGNLLRTTTRVCQVRATGRHLFPMWRQGSGILTDGGCDGDSTH